MAKKSKRTRREITERELHEERRYGFFWYDWIWRILRPMMVFAASFVIVCGLVYTGASYIGDMFFSPVDSADTAVVEFEVASGSSLSTVARNLENDGFTVTVHGKGTYVVCVNSELLLEEQKKELETELEHTIQKGRRLGLSNEDIKTLFEIVLEG